ncbi:MAG: TetR family transcriptional regulator [Pseudomonadota bacterium]|nr:TetR family transcriptional regulator [Pseudomonadota bacterium]
MLVSKSPSSPVATRTRILDVAERLFVRHGYDGTSLRMITSDAGVNLAAVNYHFGGKEALMEAVLKRRLDWLNEERMRVLDELEARSGGQPPRPHQIVEAFFGTLIGMGCNRERGGEVFLRLIGRSFTSPNGFIRALLADEYREVVERYKQAFVDALPEVPREEIAWRFQFMLGATAYALAGSDFLQVSAEFEADELPEQQVRRLWPRLYSFLVGGMRAPLPQGELAPLCAGFGDTDAADDVEALA